MHTKTPHRDATYKTVVKSHVGELLVVVVVALKVLGVNRVLAEAASVHISRWHRYFAINGSRWTSSCD